MTSTWKAHLLDQVESEIRVKFSRAVTIERQMDEDGEMRLNAYWSIHGGGAFVRLPADVTTTAINAKQATEHVLNRLWECAPIVGSC